MPSLPRLSVVMFTHGPVPLVAAALRHVRPIAHEIVVAVDDRTPIDQLGPLQEVADRVIRAEFVPPLEANLHWLHQQATGDWVLRLDGDDLVSEALLRRLSTPGWDHGITHAYVQYRWLFGSPDRMIDQAPWWPDPTLRLIRNVPGLASFPHGAHAAPTVAGPARSWDAPIYHLDLLVRDEATRAEKSLGYEDDAPGHRTDRGWSVSTTYYLPERLPQPPRTAPLPPVDAAVAAQVLAVHQSAAPIAPPRDPLALEQVVTAASRRTPAPSPGDARLRLLAHDPITVVEGRSAVVTVGVVNRSGRTWSPTDDPADVVGGRFLDAAGAPVGFELREPLPGPIAADDEALVRLSLPAGLPVRAEHLQVGLVQDGVGWHDALASARIRVVPGRRVLVSTGISTFPHLGDDLITREVLGALARNLPDVVPVLLAHPTTGIAERFGCEVVASPASLPTGSRTDGSRRSRDLVTQARLMAKGDEPSDPVIGTVLAPFAAASALVLAPGGGLASRYSDEALMVCAGEALIARAFGLPVLVEGPSIGPIEMRKDHAALAQLLNDSTRITVRDDNSADAARRIGRAIQPIVVPDPATAAVGRLGAGARTAREWLSARNVPADRAYAVISLRGGSRDAAHLATVRAAVEALPEHTALIFLPHCVDGPGAAGIDDRNLLADEWAGAHLVSWDPALGDRAAVGLVAGAAITIGTRFHLSVLAAAAGVRAIALVGDEYDRLRIRGLKRSAGVRVVELDDAGAAGAAVADLLAAPDPEPGELWDPVAFAAALAEVLPTAPRLG